MFDWLPTNLSGFIIDHMPAEFSGFFSYLSVCLFVGLSVCRFVCLSVCLFVCFYVFLCFCLSVFCLSVCVY